MNCNYLRELVDAAVSGLRRKNSHNVLEDPKLNLQISGVKSPTFDVADMEVKEQHGSGGELGTTAFEESVKLNIS